MMHIIRITRIFSIIILAITFLTGCKPANTSASDRQKSNFHDLTLLARNEDTLNSYQLAITKDKRFYYNIIANDGLKTAFNYGGKISSQSSFDTLFLEYDKRGKPFGLKAYLVREASGDYFIQFFDSTSKRIFLRRQKVGHWF